MIKRERGEEIWVKVACLNIDTGKLALISTTNKKEHITSKGHRAIKTTGGEWFVGHYRMLAPEMFWMELRDRVCGYT
jgi:hypothetical protein